MLKCANGVLSPAFSEQPSSGRSLNHPKHYLGYVDVGGWLVVILACPLGPLRCALSQPVCPRADWPTPIRDG